MYSPGLMARVNVSRNPLIMWVTSPLDPIDSITPTNTLTPLNASVLAPGK
jgi:hypothetical protein